MMGGVDRWMDGCNGVSEFPRLRLGKWQTPSQHTRRSCVIVDMSTCAAKEVLQQHLQASGLFARASARMLAGGIAP